MSTKPVVIDSDFFSSADNLDRPNRVSECQNGFTIRLVVMASRLECGKYIQ